MARYKPDPEYDAGQIIDDLGFAVAEMYADITRRLERRLAQALRSAIRDYPDPLQRAAVVRDLEQYSRLLFAQINAAGLAERIVGIAEEKGIAAALAEIEPARFLPRAGNLRETSVNAAIALRADLQNQLEYGHLRILSSYPSIYRDTVARMAPDLLLGVATTQQVQRNIVNDLLRQGVTGFTDRAGRRYTLGAHVERAVRTAAARAWQDASIAQQQSVGLNLVHVFCGRSACDRCRPWAGKILSTDGMAAGRYQIENVATGEQVWVTVAGTLEQARAAGFQHPNDNCACPVFLAGLSKPVDGSQLDPQRYRDEQAQRGMERGIRDLKRQLASATPSQAVGIRTQIRAVQKDLRDFTEEAGLVRRSYREQLTFSDGGTVNPRA